MTLSYKSCLKCGYTRTAADEATPNIMCPKCGAIYAKVEAAMQAQNAKDGLSSASPLAASPKSVSLPEPAAHRAYASATQGVTAATASAAGAASNEKIRGSDEDIGIVTIDANELKSAPIAHLIYATQLIAPMLPPIMGSLYVWLSLATVLPIAAIIVAYVKRTPDRDSWLDSHFTWQIRTFWIGMISGAVLLVAGLSFGAMTVLGFANNSGRAETGFYGLIVLGALIVVVGLWLLFRILKGWVRLFKNERMD
jgi:uncharacterized membrane protein